MRQQVRIAHVITSLGSGGAERMLARVVSGLQQNGVSNTVIVLKRSDFVEREILNSGASVVQLEFRRSLSDFKALFRLIRLLRSDQFDVIQTWLYHGDIAGTLAWLCSGRKGRLLWNLRCSELDFGSYFFATRFVVKTLSFLSFLPERVLYNSHKGKAAHAAYGYHPKAWTYVPNGFDLDRFRPDLNVRKRIRGELGLSESDFVVGMIARFDPMKDHETFISACEALLGEGVSMKILLVGRGIDRNNRELDQLLSRGKLKDSVVLLGERKDVESILNALDLLCLSSCYGEGFPNVLGEAMASGVPCVATDAGDSAEVVGECGVVVPVKNPAAFADAMRGFIRLSPEARKERGESARKRVLERFSIATVVDQYLQIYRD